MELGVSGIARTPEDKFMWDLGRLDLDNIVTAQPKELGACVLEGSVSPEDHHIVDMSVEFGVIVGGLAANEVGAPDEKAKGTMPPLTNH